VEEELQHQEKLILLNGTIQIDSLLEYLFFKKEKLQNYYSQVGAHLMKGIQRMKELCIKNMQSVLASLQMQ